MRDIWFTSDQHFDHENVIKYCNRPFSSKEEMNEIIINNYNILVKPNDIVYHLGDFAMAFKPVQLIAPRLMGKKHLILGNHDHAHPSHRKFKKEPNRWARFYLNSGFESVELSKTLEVNDLRILLSHFPYKNLEPGEYGLKHVQYRPDNGGLPLLHGHVHQAWKINNNMINVGVDVWDYKPIHIDQLLEIIKKI